MYSLRQKVAFFAFISRIFIIFIQVIANAVIPDHHADAFVSPGNPSDRKGWMDRVVTFLFGGFHHWDAEYFLHIARYGYTHENCLAFFPLYPLSIRWTSEVFTSLFGSHLSTGSIFLFSSVFFNVFCFVKVAVLLFDLTARCFGDDNMAYRSAILFCVNPASIFFSAPYSETLFALLSFQGMVNMENISKGVAWSSIPFGLGAAARSNGLTNVGFLVHSEAKAIVDVAQRSSWQDVMFRSLKSSWRLLIGVLLLVAPFATFQVYAVMRFCNPSGDVLPSFLMSYAAENNLVVPGVGDLPAWCNASSLSYTEVQSRYWDVGFLRYFQWKQLPNFILAAPMFILIVRGSLCFFKQHKKLCYNLGLWKVQRVQKRRTSQPDILQRANEEFKKLEFPPGVFVYIAHVLSLLLICFFFIHVQVTTRLLASASPVPYWFAAYFICPTAVRESSLPAALKVESEENMYSCWRVFAISDWSKHPGFAELSTSQRRVSLLTKWYFLSYTLLGTVLFSNNLPWT